MDTKKLLAVMLALMVALVGCANGTSDSDETEEEKIDVWTTVTSDTTGEITGTWVNETTFDMNGVLVKERIVYVIGVDTYLVDLIDVSNANDTQIESFKENAISSFKEMYGENASITFDENTKVLRIKFDIGLLGFAVMVSQGTIKANQDYSKLKFVNAETLEEKIYTRF